MAGAVFGQVQLSLLVFVAGAVFSGCGLTGSCPDRSRMMFQPFSANFSHILDGHCPWQAQHLLTLEGDTCYLLHPVARRIVNDVSYVRRINHESHFSWQAQCVLTLAGGTCCSAHCK